MKESGSTVPCLHFLVSGLGCGVFVFFIVFVFVLFRRGGGREEVEGKGKKRVGGKGKKGGGRRGDPRGVPLASGGKKSF